MATITASMVKDLREMTGAGMMDCKNALTEVSGDLEAAVDWLRKKGLSKAAKKAGRVAAEGLVAVAVDGTRGVVVEVNSETDFVARNPDFQTMVKGVADVALRIGDDVEAIKAAPHPAGGGTVENHIANLVATIGENMTLRRAKHFAVQAGVVARYVHTAVAPDMGRIGVVVALSSSGDRERLSEFGRQVAMHIAASNPLAVEAAGLDPVIVEREKTVLADKYRAQGKPEAAIAKILESGMKTYFKEVCLVDQMFIMDGSKSVGQAVKDLAASLKADVSIAGFARFALGDGIEKQETDFAAEVAAVAGGN